jgi:hypothetical protein
MSSTVSDSMFVSVLTNHKIKPEKVTLFLTPPRPHSLNEVFYFPVIFHGKKGKRKTCTYPWSKRQQGMVMSQQTFPTLDKEIGLLRFLN